MTCDGLVTLQVPSHGLQGVGYTYGLEPGFLGALGFYAPGWEYREGPVQLTSLLPNASGVQELEEFRCYMTGDAHHRVDLVQSFEVRENPFLLLLCRTHDQ